MIKSSGSWIGGRSDSAGLWTTPAGVARGHVYPGAVDIEPEWAQEVLGDPYMLWLEPDPKSSSGLGIRLVGYSLSAGFVLTVIVYRSGSRLHGVTAYKANGSDLRAYRKGVS